MEFEVHDDQNLIVRPAKKKIGRNPMDYPTILNARAVLSCLDIIVNNG
jgi:hypothetical protein